MHDNNKIRNPIRLATKQEREEFRAILEHNRRLRHWYWRLWEWLKAVKHCVGWALHEFKECYRERND